MKYAMLFIVAATMLFSCKKEGVEPIMETPESNEQSQELYIGSFQSDAHTTAGKLTVEYDGLMTNLVFTNFVTDAGPDLRVYLSTSTTDDEYLDLGELKSIQGDFYYEVENDTDFESYDHVLIWCEDFSVLFGHSKLIKQ